MSQLEEAFRFSRNGSRVIFVFCNLGCTPLLHAPTDAANDFARSDGAMAGGPCRWVSIPYSQSTVCLIISISSCSIGRSSYLIHMLVAAMAGQKSNQLKNPAPELQTSFSGAACPYQSVSLLILSLSLLQRCSTTMWEGVPEVVSVFLFFLFMSIVGTFEGMQISFLAMSKRSKEEQSKQPMAMKVYDILFRGDGRNLSGFMVGRQICVTLCFFIISRVTSLNVDIEAGEETIFGMSNGMRQFFNTGLLGAIITIIVGSISWQLVASAFPIVFLDNPIV